MNYNWHIYKIYPTQTTTKQFCENLQQIPLRICSFLSNFVMFVFIALHHQSDVVYCTLCGNFRIFLPLSFYVKLILGILQYQALSFLTISEALNFDFWWICVICRGRNFSKIKSKNFEKYQNDGFWDSQFAKKWFHVKYETIC